MKFIDKFKEKELWYTVNKSRVTWAKAVYHNHQAVKSKEKGLNRMLSLLAAVSEFLPSHS